MHRMGGGDKKEIFSNPSEILRGKFELEKIGGKGKTEEKWGGEWEMSKYYSDFPNFMVLI